MLTCFRNFLRICACFGWTTILHGFPPAPFYTIYGDVRNAYGELIPAEGAAVILYAGEKEILRQSLTAVADADYNYQVRLRIDMMRTAGSYSSLALNPGAAYSVAVNVGGQLFYPLEIDAPRTVGAPAERRRLNLTLGTDDDGDGLPDAWEENQLYNAGYEPGPDGWDLSAISRDGDFDGDGMGNWAEFVAGAYATDYTSVLELEIREVLDDLVRLEFYAIYGKTYALEVSIDMARWAAAPFSINEADAPDATAAHLRSETTGVISVYTASNDDRVFYRLTVR